MVFGMSVCLSTCLIVTKKLQRIISHYLIDTRYDWMARKSVKDIISPLKLPHTVLSLINAPGALQFFKRGMFIRGKFSMQKCSV